MAKIIFYQKNGFEEIERWCSAYLKEGDIVFERDRHLHRCAGRTYEDYLSEEDCHQIDAAALRFSENWYKDSSGRDLTICGGISLGRMVEYKLMKYFVAILKDIALLCRLKEKEAPESFAFADDGYTFSELLKEFSKCHRIAAEPICLQAGEGIKGEAQREERSKGLGDNIKGILWNILVYLHAKIFGVGVYSAKFFGKRNTSANTIAIEGYGKFIPLIKELAKGGKRVIVMGRLGFEKGLFHPNISYYNWGMPQGDFPPPDTKGLLERRFIFRDFDATAVILKRLDEIIRADFPRIKAMIPKIKKIFMDEKIDTIIILQDRDGINRILAACGNLLGLDTIELQHGTLANLPYLVSPMSKKICVWGRASKEFYLKRGVEDKRIYITGGHYLGRLKRLPPRRVSRIKNALGIRGDRPVALFASQPFVEITSLDSPLNTINLFESICESARRLRDVEFVIKFHPNENSGMKREILKRYRYNNIYAAEIGLTNELLSLSHVLITFCSSIALEAGLLGIPIIMVNLTGRRDLLPLAEMGGALGVYKKEDIVPAIVNVLYDRQIQKKLAEGAAKFVESQIDLMGPGIETVLG